MKPTLLYLGPGIPEAAMAQRRAILAPHWGCSPDDIVVICNDLFLGHRGPSIEQLIAERIGSPADSDAVREARSDFVEIYDPRVNARGIVTACIAQLAEGGLEVRGIELSFERMNDELDQERHTTTLIVTEDEVVSSEETQPIFDERDSFGYNSLELLRANTPVPLLLARLELRAPGETADDASRVINRSDPNDDGTLWPDSQRPTGAFVGLKHGDEDLYDEADNVVLSIIGYEQRTVI